MDLKSLISQATKIVHTTNEPLRPEPVILDNEDRAAPDDEDQVNLDAILDTTELIEQQMENQSELDCAHLCDCGKWWSHGLKQKCRYPDLVKQGKCPTCLDSGASTSGTWTLEEDYKENDKGDRKLSPKAQVIIRNEETKRIKDMSVEQLTYHMTFLSMKIEELRIQALQTRHKRTELEEELSKDVPEGEREAFIRALQTGRKKKEKKQTVPKLNKKEQVEEKEKQLIVSITQEGRPLADAKVIASMMIRTGKSQKQVETMLYD